MKPILLLALLLAGCATPVPVAEIAVQPAPEIPPRVAPPVLVQRRIAGQVFIVTRGRDTVKMSGVTVRIYDAAYLSVARATMMKYAATAVEFTPETTRLGMAGLQRQMRAFNEREAGIARGWATIELPIRVITTDADGRFEIEGQLPEKIGVYCEASRMLVGDVERYRWALTEDRISDPARIMLSNGNLEP